MFDIIQMEVRIMTIMHVDVNSAYLSWTAVNLLKQGFGRDIREIPSVIGGNQEERHGIVLAKSISAKKYGDSGNVPTGGDEEE